MSGCCALGWNSYSLLCELAGTLVLGVAEEFDDTALVWCESRNLLHDLPNKLGALASLSLGSADTGLDNACLCFVSLVWADGDAAALGLGGCHCCCGWRWRCRGLSLIPH